MPIETQLIFDEFQGGRFYRGRYVYSVSCHLPILDYGFWTDRVTRQTYQELRAFAEMSYAPTSRKERGTHRNRRSATVFSFHNDTPSYKLFGLNQDQFFNRMLKMKTIVAVDRGRTGWWFCESPLLPLLRIERGSRYLCGRIAKDNRHLFERVIATRDEDYQFTKPDYSLLDLGPDRKPPVWVCNLCQRTAEWKDWPKGDMPGIANSDYIRQCPQCNATTGDMFERMVDSIRGTAKFRPERRMQDDFYFTII